MKEPHYINNPKKLPNGKPNPAHYEELMEAVSELLPTDKELTIEPCTVCGEKGVSMYDYKRDKWYMECLMCVPEEKDIIYRDTRRKAEIAWNVAQIIAQFEKKGIV